MSRFLKYTYPAALGDEVCALQDVGDVGPVLLNGTLADPMGNNVSFISRGYCRTISVNSANDLSAVTFTVTGTQNGVELTEDITGPGANLTVFGNVIFDNITSVTTDTAIHGVQLGGGISGFFTLIGVDPFLKPINYTLRASEGGTIFLNDVTLTLYGSNEELAFNGLTYLDNISMAIAFMITSVANNLLFPDGIAIGLVAPYVPLVQNLLLKVDNQAANILRGTVLTFTPS